MREMKRGSSGSEKKGACSLRCYSAWLAQSNPSHLKSTQPNPGLANPKGALLLLLPVSFPSIRYTQGKQEGIRMGPDRHLVCWEISLGQSERLPSPLPAPAHQMWGEGHITSSLCSAAWVHSLSLSLLSLTLDGICTVRPNTYLCVGIHMLSDIQSWVYRHADNTYRYLQAQKEHKIKC